MEVGGQMGDVERAGKDRQGGGWCLAGRGTDGGLKTTAMHGGRVLCGRRAGKGGEGKRARGRGESEEQVREWVRA